jgi:hypothetical protein
VSTVSPCARLTVVDELPVGIDHPSVVQARKNNVSNASRYASSQKGRGSLVNFSGLTQHGLSHGVQLIDGRIIERNHQGRETVNDGVFPPRIVDTRQEVIRTAEFAGQRRTTCGSRMLTSRRVAL